MFLACGLLVFFSSSSSQDRILLHPAVAGDGWCAEAGSTDGYSSLLLYELKRETYVNGDHPRRV